MAVDLHEFEFGTIGPWTDHYEPDDNKWIMIGDYCDQYVPTCDPILDPGESFWISVDYDFAEERHAADPLQFGPNPILLEQKNADIVMHAYEAPSGPTDSVSVNWTVMELWNGRDCWYIRHHLDNGDSAVVDQVGGVWDGDPGNNGLGRNQDKAYDVAGFTDATNNAILVRKFNIKEGNLNFAEGRGLDAQDSEWLPIPQQRHYSGWLEGKKMYWTVGNHGNYVVDETTLTSSTLDVDWTNHVLNVPWGIHNKDSVMIEFDYHEGLAWNYKLDTDTVEGENWEQAYVDSSYISARTGDTLIVWAAGNVLDEVRFHINVLDPTDDANMVIPRSAPDYETGVFGDWHGPVFEVTDGNEIPDIPFATRTDSLLKYLEKAPNAEWEFVFADVERPDLRAGDILRVTAENGDVRDYALDIMPYNPNHNAELSSVTWPDIPEYYKDTYGYIGDTIPNFQRNVYTYNAIVPVDVDVIPALVAKPVDLNTNVEVDRAVNLFGTIADQTVTFTSTAEDDTTVLVYSIRLNKQLDEEDIQHWKGEPFVSQFVWQDQWSNGMLEICNPGTVPLDLSDYMVMFQYNNDPNTIITWNSGVDDWMDRYVKYIPGYKWVSEEEWAVNPGTAEQDINIDPIVLPGDVFVLGSIRTRSQSGWSTGDNWWVDDQIDIDFIDNPWGEEVGATWGTQWINASWFMWKILNDSIKEGTKAANDPADFELLEAWASNEGNWVIGGRDGNADNQTVSWVRKPQYYKGNPVNEGSWGNTVDNGTKEQDGTSEWYCYDRHYGVVAGYNWPFDILHITYDIGMHSFYEVTEYKSTVSSLVYLVSQGYSMDEEIRGLVTGVTVTDFYSNILKKDEDQVLTVISEGTALADDAVISNGDSLVVVSANGDNTSKYFLEVTDEGLNSDAVLVSDTYDITVDGSTGTVGGFDYGTTLKTVIDGTTLPSGARMDVIDQNGLYVATKKLNFDTTYVETQVSDQIFFDVTAEDGATKILYQLIPNSTDADAFVVSEVYDVNQETFLISLVPEGTAVPAFYANLTPAAGAAMQVKDKLGFDRAQGNLYLDDVLTVTAADGETENTYFLEMLAQEADYLAYVLSDVYVVDQNAKTIDGGTDLNEATLVSEVKGNLELAPGASMTFMNADGSVKADGDDMNDGDMLEVVAGNQVTVRIYDIIVDPSSARDAADNGISVYPNPSSGIINVSGLEAGNRIQVYNAVGARVLDNVVTSTTEVLSLDDQKQGFYFMTISNEDGIIGHYKLVIE
ncbi:MAG: T9SS type A sorting domain-containing protein [Bacteroidales bacterium]|nr:T9SS type A sorting domain-containing protein [Bacteroidales bacterium]